MHHQSGKSSCYPQCPHDHFMETNPARIGCRHFMETTSSRPRRGAFALPFLGAIPSTMGSFTPLGTPTRREKAPSLAGPPPNWGNKSKTRARTPVCITCERIHWRTRYWNCCQKILPDGSEMCNNWLSCTFDVSLTRRTRRRREELYAYA